MESTFASALRELQKGESNWEPLMLVSAAAFVVIVWAWWWDAPLRLSLFFKRHILGKKNTPRLPPGGMGLPFVGETLYALLSREPDKLPAYRRRKAKRYGDVYCGSLPPLSSCSITFCSDEGVKWGLSMENRGLEGVWPPSVQQLLGRNSLTVLTGKAHKRMRSALTPVFQPKYLRDYVARMNDIVKEHLDKHWGSTTTTTICAREEMKSLTFKIIADLVLGLDLDKDRQIVAELRHLFEVWFAGLFSPAWKIPGTPFAGAVKARKRIKEILIPVIQRRRDQKGASEKKDVLDILLAPTKDDAGQEILLTNDEIFDTLVVLLFAGSDTSTCNMTWVMKLASEHPQVFQRLRAEHVALVSKQKNPDGVTHISWDEIESLRYTNQVIFEVLRVRPPVQGSFRLAKKDLTYNGFLIPKGYMVSFDYKTMTEDPRYHKSVDVFNPDRFESQDNAIGGLSHAGFTPFGGGARMCIGYRMAIAEMNVFIHHMVMNYSWSLSPETRDNMTYFPLEMPTDGVLLDVKRRDRSNDDM